MGTIPTVLHFFSHQGTSQPAPVHHGSGFRGHASQLSQPDLFQPSFKSAEASHLVCKENNPGRELCTPSVAMFPPCSGHNSVLLLTSKAI